VHVCLQFSLRYFTDQNNLYSTQSCSTKCDHLVIYKKELNKVAAVSI